MFDKDAEEIAYKRLCSETICFNRCNYSSPKHHRCGECHRCYESAKEGIELGCKKANEWHFVRDGDLPKKSDKVVGRDILDNPFIAWYKDGEWKDENGETLTTSIIAWKEIVPPKESE